MGSTTTFFCAVFSAASDLLSLNSALGVKVGLRAAVFYGFPYKLRPKTKIALTLDHVLGSLVLATMLEK